MKGKNIIGLTYTEKKNKYLYHKITLDDDIKIEGLVKMVANEDAGSFMINRDEYFKALVSLWEENPKNKNRKMLCFGVIVTSILIMITKNCNENLHTLEHIGIIFGSNHSTANNLDFILEERKEIRVRAHLAFLLVSGLTYIYTIEGLKADDYIGGGEPF